MRLAVLADIHGNLPALEAVLADAEQQNVDGMIVAGDFLDRPQPLEAVRAVRALDACVIRGNRENYLLAYHKLDAPDHWHTSKQWIGVRWLHERLDGEAWEYIESLPEECVYAANGKDPIRVVHGSPGSVTRPIVPSPDPDATALYKQAGLLDLRRRKVDAVQAFALFDEAVLVCAHTHISWKQEQDGRLVVNPGSIGIPINGDTRAQYALLTWRGGRWKAQLRAVDYDRGRIRAAYEESGILAVEGAFAVAQLCAIETGRSVPSWLTSHCRRQAALAGIPESEGIPDAIWDEAVAAFDWEAAARGLCGRQEQSE